MLITLRPGANRENLLKNLQYVQSEVSNLRGGGGGHNAQERVLAYLDWTNSAVRMLAGQIDDRGLHHLVLTDRYKLLLAGAGTLTGMDTPTQRVVNGLLSQELEERVAALGRAIDTLQRETQRWSGYRHLVMPDTSFYIHHTEKLEEFGFRPVIDVCETEVSVLIPMVVVDELDRLKESKDKHVRWRARHTLAVLDQRFEQRTGRAPLRSGSVEPGPGGRRPSEVTLELLFDPPGHVRLPIEDDEIIDRALSVEPLADRKVTLLTYDTGQSMRARNAGLHAIKFSQEAGQ